MLPQGDGDRSPPLRQTVVRRRRRQGGLFTRAGPGQRFAGSLWGAIRTSWELQFALPAEEGEPAWERGIMEPGNDPILRALAPGRRHLIRGTTETLQSLGASPGAVAASLLAAGVRGEPGDPRTTPLAAFLSSVVGADPGVASASVSAVNLTITRPSRWRRTVVVPFPPPIVAFVTAFEAGCYPELVRTR